MANVDEQLFTVNAIVDLSCSCDAQYSIPASRLLYGQMDQIVFTASDRYNEIATDVCNDCLVLGAINGNDPDVSICP